MFGNRNDMFSERRSRGGGISELGGLQLLTLVLSVISAVAFLYVICNFGRISMSIAVWVVNFLTSGTPLFLLIIGVPILMTVFKWKMWSHFWRR